MTRCYGWSLPYTMIIPFADCLNHHFYSVDHCMVDLDHEKLCQSESYNLKKNKVNLEILDLNKIQSRSNWKIDFIKKYLFY